VHVIEVFVVGALIIIIFIINIVDDTIIFDIHGFIWTVIIVNIVILVIAF
jgi:hypothetical protein